MATIDINPERVVAQVDRRILAGFTEHLERCVYGGIFDEGSPLSDSEGFRTDVLAAVRALKPPVLRWPGGNFVSGYHWTDGVGPKERRPRKMELTWHVEESNRFGTDEFMRYCELVGAEPYLCVNMGTGSVDEAQGWLEYCNGTGDTYWANLRRSNGREAPYGVRYWGLGNEVYGPWQIGAMGAADYVKAARQWAKVLKWTDPSIELVSCGEKGWSDWDSVVIEGLAEFVRWHSIHIYTGSQDYWSNVLAPHQAERALRITGALIEQARYNQHIAHPIHVAYDEWNVRLGQPAGPAQHAERYTLADALAVGTYLHAFVRQADVVKMANQAQLVNVLAPIVTSSTGLFLQTIYHPMRLFADHLGQASVDVYVDCDRHSLTEILDSPGDARVADLGPFPVLDVVSTKSTRDRKLMISVINRSPDADVEAEFGLPDDFPVETATVEELNGSEWNATNSFEHPERVVVAEGEIEKFKTGVRHLFPAHSMTVITLPYR